MGVGRPAHAQAAARLDAWPAAVAKADPSTLAGAVQVLAAVHAALDNDLDTPTALAAVDAGAKNSVDVTAAAELLGVYLTD